MEQAVDVSEIVRNYGIVVGGVLGILVATWRSWTNQQQARAAKEQARIADRTHASEIYAETVSRLSDNRMAVRYGAIYTLRQLASDYPSFTRPSLKALSVTLEEIAQSGDTPLEDKFRFEISRAISLITGETNDDNTQGT